MKNKDLSSMWEKGVSLVELTDELIDESLRSDNDRVREKVWEKFSEHSSLIPSSEQLRLGVTDPNEYIRLTVWNRYNKTAQIDDELRLIGVKDSSKDVREWVWSASGFFSPTMEMIKIGLRDESAVVRKNVWKLAKYEWWYPKPEEFGLGLSDKDYFVRAEVAEVKSLPLTEDLLNKLVADKSPVVQVVIWSREDWAPQRNHIEQAIDSHPAVQECLWKNLNWVPQPEDIEEALLSKESGVQEGLWERKDWVPSESQVERVMMSGSLLAPVLAMMRDDWERTPNLIQKGLSDVFNATSPDEWEPYRPILEAAQLKARVGSLSSQSPSKAL